MGSTELDGMVLDGAVLGGVVWYDTILDGMVWSTKYAPNKGKREIYQIILLPMALLLATICLLKGMVYGAPKNIRSSTGVAK